MSRCIQRSLQRLYEEVRPQLRDGRTHERPSRSLGRQVPADATRSRQGPTIAAPSRRPLVAATKAIETAHPAPTPAKKAAAGSVVTLFTVWMRLASTLQTPVNSVSTAARSAAEAIACACLGGVKAHGLARRADLGPEPTPTNSHLAKTMRTLFATIFELYAPFSAPQLTQLL